MKTVFRDRAGLPGRLTPDDDIGPETSERLALVQSQRAAMGAGHVPGDLMIKLLQDHVKAVIAPYKYPRSVVFTKALPKTETGKIQRFRLREGS